MTPRLFAGIEIISRIVRDYEHQFSAANPAVLQGKSRLVRLKRAVLR